MVTAELGVGLGAAVLVLAVGLQSVSLGLDQVRCVDAAHVAARAAARGDPAEQVRRLALERAPRGSTAEIGRTAETVVVRVAAPRRSGGGWVRAMPLARAEASAPVEATAPAWASR